MDYLKAFKKYQKKINPASFKFVPKRKKYEFFFIIPAFSEKDYIKETLASISNQNQLILNKLLVIVIINNLENDDQKVIENNLATYKMLNKLKFNFELITFDCFSKNNAFKKNNGGVGLARKIGMDFCLRFSKKNSLFFSLDADTIIHKNYLDIIIEKYTKYNFCSAVINFKHRTSIDTDLNIKIIKYENLLKSIARNIHKTGSPYGYVSMGSTIVCTSEAYLAIGGMYPNKATEDFYFLQSLAKYNKVYQIKNQLVFPSSRAEQRVYLGTGFRMLSDNNNFNDLIFKEEAYKSLKFIYDVMQDFWKENEKLICNKFKLYDEKIFNFMIKHNFIKTISQIKLNTKNKLQFLKQFHNWFDSLKIYKFLKLYVKN